MESVWDYPRPPRIEHERRAVRVELRGQLIASSERALRCLETSHPPTLYIPFADVAMELLSESRARQTLCEWKGMAAYFDVLEERAAAWWYPSPVPAYESLAQHVSLYPGRMDACWLGDERVQTQAGDFYGGWITSDLEGPFKGGPGTLGW
jgi:uncharacterized protein (DUF427 family)